jgi:polyhydroxybutyrate depolymerase
VLHIHGTADTNHPIDGGTGSGLAGVDFHSARSSVDALAAAGRCTNGPMSAPTSSNPDLTVITWTGCSNDTTVRYVIVEGATHAWMGHAAASAAAAGFVGEPYAGLDASRAIWSFLAAHSRT